MNEISVANFRCFSEKQTVRLAPLTLLVGDNSTGKTSFLALVRALWDVGIRDQIPDFRESPFDLGTFDDIAHFRGGRGGRAQTFEAGCLMRSVRRGKSRGPPLRYDFTFREYGSGVLPYVRRIGTDRAWVECEISEDGSVSVGIETRQKKWQLPPRYTDRLGRLAAPLSWKSQQGDLPPVRYFIRTLWLALTQPELDLFENGDDAFVATENDIEVIGDLYRRLWHPMQPTHRPFSSAPVRSRPLRTYDEGQTIPDPEGEYVPRLLAAMSRNDPEGWNRLKKSLEDFGRSAGLFDDIMVRDLGGKAGGPFQILVRKRGKRAKGPYRNLIDMGYGVSQALPVVVDLLRPPIVPQVFLLQQPEVHLHPSAQAAIGELLLKVARRTGQPVIVETHSDHLIDRIRMEVRDRRTEIGPDGVTILYFERGNLSVRIHALGWDDNGNLVAKQGDIPDTYRAFFRRESWRSLGI